MARSESARQVRTVGCWKENRSKNKEKEMEQGITGTGNKGQDMGVPRESPPGADIPQTYSTAVTCCCVWAS